MAVAFRTKVRTITLPPLPWADNALEPFISKNTVGFHYGKHDQTYMDKSPREIAEKIESSFGGYDAFREKVAEAAVGQFGSGWAWLLAEGGTLSERRSTTPMQGPG